MMVVDTLEGYGRYWRFVWQALLVTLHLSRRQKYAGRYRTRVERGNIWQQMFDIGTRSVPVVMITGAFVGMTLAVQAFAQFAGLGIQDRLGSVINISVVKELGPVLAAIMLAGRVGGALTAELGTMKITEQIDAVRAMGADPMRYLVMPRFLACLLLTPILTIYADLLGVIGGYVMTVWYFKVSSDSFWRYSADVVENWDIFVGVFKGLFFGASIALISCYKGFNSEPGARGVGKACTVAFVYSFIAILIIDFILVVVFKGISDTIWGEKLYSLM